MSKFILRHEDEHYEDNTPTSYEAVFHSSDLSDIQDRMDQFLKGCGFVFDEEWAHKSIGEIHDILLEVLHPEEKIRRIKVIVSQYMRD